MKKESSYLMSLNKKLTLDLIRIFKIRRFSSDGVKELSKTTRLGNKIEHY